MKEQHFTEEQQYPYKTITYRRIRKIIGYMGISLPIVLVAFSYIGFFKTTLKPAISYYYYTNLRELFTGTMSAVGVFLICYKGFGNRSIWKNDNLHTNLAGMIAICIAFVPTNPVNAAEKVDTIFPYNAVWIGWIHNVLAAILFLIFALLVINVFTIGQENKDNLPVSLFNENNVYRFCGYGILVCLAATLVWAVFDLFLFPYSTLIFESVALFLFGTAWLIKGRALGDKGKIGAKLYRERH